MNTGKLVGAAALIFMVAAALPARAAECDDFQRTVKKFQTDQDAVEKEQKRIAAANPAPPDAAYCLAIRRLGVDAIFVEQYASAGCFRTEQGMNDFQAGVRSLRDSTVEMVGIWCSRADRSLPID